MPLSISTRSIWRLERYRAWQHAGRSRKSNSRALEGPACTASEKTELALAPFGNDAHHADFGCAAGRATASQTNRSHHPRTAGRLTLARGFRLLERCLL
jgi:hypothetical protein